MVFVISGPPGAGKTTLCHALSAHYKQFVHIPVDDMRTWVTSGLAESVPWTEETERQFKIAEKATCSVARIYFDAGFCVAIDHCRNPNRLDSLIDAELSGLPVRRVLLLPSLPINLARNAARRNKDFDPAVLAETIQFTNSAYRHDAGEGWIVIDNSKISVDQTIELVAVDLL